MAYTYPTTVYDVPTNLLAALGTFWMSTYAGRDQLVTHGQAIGQIGNQAVVDLLETMAALSRFTVPIYHRDNWYALQLLESTRNDAQTSLPALDTGLTYDSGLAYDTPQRAVGHAFPLPADLVSAPLVMNRFITPSLTMTDGVDYIISDGAIIFRDNPFLDARVAKRPVFEDGEATDQEALLWVFRGNFDWQQAYTQFGYVIGLKMRSSTGYRDLMNAVFDAIVGGTSRNQLLTALSAITGIPLVKETTETVVDIWMDNTARLVITDQHAYRFHREATVTVEVGDVVSAGDSLIDALAVYEFNRGVCPDTLRALAVDRGFLASCLYGDLVFENQDFPLTVITDDPSGFTKLTWPLGGHPLTVEAFFDELHARGVAAAAEADPCDTATPVTYPGDDCDTFTVQRRKGTLAHLLDRRDNPTGEPVASNLPRTINPLEFLIANVLRNHAWAVRIYIPHLGETRLGLHNLRFLRKIIPPHTAMFLVMETSPRSDTVSSAVEDQVTTFTGAETLVDSLTLGTDRLRARVVSGSCY